MWSILRRLTTITTAQEGNNQAGAGRAAEGIDDRPAFGLLQ